MAQRRKPEVRERILRVATAELRERGFHGAGMAAIATRADLSAGNLYRYFSGKQALFEAVIDDGFVARFEALLDARIGSLSVLGDPRRLDAPARAHQDQLLQFFVEERERVVILLDRCQGTRHEDFGARFVERLTARLLEHLGPSAGEPPVETVVRAVFDGTRRTLVAILDAHRDPVAIRTAFTTFWSFQLAGLAGLSQEIRP